MSTRLLGTLTLLLLAAAGFAQAQPPLPIELFQTIKAKQNDLARYQYLATAIPKLSGYERSAATQLLAWTEDELGLYSEAVHDFPLVPRIPARLSLPLSAEWEARDAVDAIATLATHERLVMLNEAHHDAHTRQLTLALLPRLRELGFGYLAVEALGDKDPGLARRGYPTMDSGSQYLREPLYGEIIRTALRLGFVVVPYDSDATDPSKREAEQATNIYRKVFTTDPQARLFVHAGYAHIDKAKGRLGDLEPMAMRLKALSGLEPLSIDQTQFRDIGSKNELDAYHQLITRFQPKLPAVVSNRETGRIWSASPRQYDVSVILPEEYGRTETGLVPAWLTFGLEGIRVQRTGQAFPRPSWLTLGGRRQAVAVSATLCKVTRPCVVEARYSDEPNDAVAADRYAFVYTETQKSQLYLAPGHYRLSAWGADGSILSEQAIEVPASGTAAAASASDRAVPAAR